MLIDALGERGDTIAAIEATDQAVVSIISRGCPFVEFREWEVVAERGEGGEL